MSILSKLKPQKGSKHRVKRLGRGDASGHGGTSTKGHKGQLARSSPHISRGFEGGQMPLHRRSPKWGFTNITKIFFNVVNLDDLSERFSSGDTVNTTTLLERRVIRKKSLPLKILGRGTLNKSLKIEANAVSETAKKAIEASKSTLKILASKSTQEAKAS